MQIYELLKKDHREVKKLFEEIKECLEAEQFYQAESLYETLKTELTAHSKAEQEVFYEPLKVASEEQEGEELVWEGEEEHHVIALLLNELSRIKADEEEWKGKLTVLSEIVDHHVEEEEGEIFKEAKKCFSDEDAERIAQNMQDLKEEYKGMVDSALAEDIELFLHPMLHTSSGQGSELNR